MAMIGVSTTHVNDSNVLKMAHEMEADEKEIENLKNQVIIITRV